MKVTITPIFIGALSTIIKGLVQGLEDLEIRGRVDPLNYSIVEIGQNIEKSSGDLRRHVVTPSSERSSVNIFVKNSQGGKQ